MCAEFVIALSFDGILIFISINNWSDLFSILHIDLLLTLRKVKNSRGKDGSTGSALGCGSDIGVSNPNEIINS